MKWERVLRNEFGTWKSNAADEERLQVSRSTAKSQSCSTMSDSYSRNIPALNNGCQIRLKLIRTIQRFLGNREWREMIPVTSDYSFLPGASFTDIQLSDDELSSDEEDHAYSREESGQPSSSKRFLKPSLPFISRRQATHEADAGL